MTIVGSLLGGTLIGGAAGALYLCEGRVAGVSGIVAGGLDPAMPDRAWRWLFVAGLVAGGALVGTLVPGTVPGTYAAAPWRLVAAGLMVGAGARLANGCTSGHGICGTARGSARSGAAVLTFMATGALTVLAVRLVGG